MVLGFRVLGFRIGKFQTYTMLGAPYPLQYCPQGWRFSLLRQVSIWEFPKTRGTLIWDPYNKDPTII